MNTGKPSRPTTTPSAHWKKRVSICKSPSSGQRAKSKDWTYRRVQPFFVPVPRALSLFHRVGLHSRTSHFTTSLVRELSTVTAECLVPRDVQPLGGAHTPFPHRPYAS